MSSRVHHSPECHLICDLTVEPDVFVCGEKPGNLWSNNTDDVSQHRNEDETAVQGQDEAGTTRRPDGPSEGVQTRQPLVRRLNKAK
jgi:hypothetical protein